MVTYETAIESPEELDESSIAAVGAGVGAPGTGVGTGVGEEVG